MTERDINDIERIAKASKKNYFMGSVWQNCECEVLVW